MTEHSEMLALAAQELLDWYNSGELKQNGVFKKYADGLVDVPERMRLRVAENNIHNEALRLAATTGTAVGREAVARVLCQSGKFETGQGTCAVLCMDQLGDVRKKGCGHCSRVHGKLADAILSLLRTALAAVVMDEKR